MPPHHETQDEERISRQDEEWVKRWLVKMRQPAGLSRLCISSRRRVSYLIEGARLQNDLKSTFDKINVFARCSLYSCLLTCLAPLSACKLVDNQIKGSFGESSAAEISAIINQAPKGADLTTQLAAKVSGSGVVAYRYKVGERDATDCDDANGYSSSDVTTASLTADLSGLADGHYVRLCVVGENAKGQWQPFSQATQHDWYKGSITANFKSYFHEVSETAGAVTLTIQLSAANTEDTTLTYDDFGSDSDYASDTSLPASGRGTVTIPAGQTTAQLDITIYNNTTAQSERMEQINLESADNGVTAASAALHKIYIEDDDSGTYSTGVTTFSAGYNHACAIVTGGTLKCWGDNSQGELGDGTTTNHLIPTVVDSGISYETVAATNADNTCAITSTGVLKCWGNNYSGQLGDGGTSTHNSPEVIDSGVSYKSVSLDNYHGCGVTSGGVLKCWGDNSKGELGDGGTTDHDLPEVINSGTSYQMVVVGGISTCAITVSGELECWGWNANGQLGDGSTTNESSPETIDSGVSYQFVSIGGDGHVCAITTAGVLKCWGSNLDSQVGDGTTTSPVTTPETIDAGTSYQAVAAGTYWTCGVTTSGTMKCWGLVSSSPKVIDSETSYQAVGVGYSYACGLTTDDRLNCWGDDSYGQLGDGTTQGHNQPESIASNMTFDRVATGENNSTCAITTDHVLNCWGDNSDGELGDGTTTNRDTPVVIDSDHLYQEITGGQTGDRCGITTTGQLKCWGINDDGELGDGTTAERTLPTVIDPSSSYQHVSTGEAHTCAITTDGILKCWGDNSLGELGDGTTTSRTSPEIIDGGTSYQFVSLGNAYSCGITSTGVLKCWGYNWEGMLGDGTTTEHTSPEVIDTGTSYITVAASQGTHTCAITATGVLKCWGGNGFYAVGDGSFSQQSSPVIIDSGASYKWVAVGESNTCAVTSDGELKCWGSFFHGNLGNGIDEAFEFTPFAIDSGTTYEKVSVSYTNTCGLTTDGALKCWGDNTYGQLGDASSHDLPAPVLNLLAP